MKNNERSGNRFLDKNKDTLSDDLMQALTGPQSTNPFVVRLMSRAFIEEKKEDGVEEKAALASPVAGAKPGPPVSLLFCQTHSKFLYLVLNSNSDHNDLIKTTTTSTTITTTRITTTKNSFE
jgi:hypothetical protein